MIPTTGIASIQIRKLGDPDDLMDYRYYRLCAGALFIAIERFTKHFCIQQGVFGDSSSVFEALNSHSLPISLHIVTESVIQQFLRILQFGDLDALSVVCVRSERENRRTTTEKHLLGYRNVLVNLSIATDNAPAHNR